jgi:hypothetical protein
MKLVRITNVLFSARFVHLVDEKLDVVDWTDHIMRDTRVQHLHLLVLLALLLELDMLGHVTY